MKVSYILVAYNQEKYVSDAVHSALQQDYRDIEFILSDDFSLDNTYQIMQDIANTYPGLDVKLNRMKKNAGLVKHLNFCLLQATGEIIIFSAGDDISLKTRVSHSVTALKNNPSVFAVSFRDREIDEGGNLLGYRFEKSRGGFYDLEKGLTAWSGTFLGASRAIRRECIEKFGLLNADLTTEDTPFLLRSLLLGGIVVLDFPGILYRRSSGALSSPEKMKTHVPSALTDQYRVDRERAFKDNIITRKDVCLVEEWIEYKELEKDVANKKTLATLFKIIYRIPCNRFLRSRLLRIKR
jgi:glycosyltransferase involved in cell wall biosynthesis